jgi:DNA modification methylase
MVTKTKANIHSVWKIGGSPFSGAHFAVFPPELIEPIVIASCPENGVILDPFGGSGTVGLVAKQHKRHFVLCDINPEIAEMARKRVTEGITKNDKVRLDKTKKAASKSKPKSEHNPKVEAPVMTELPF